MKFFGLISKREKKCGSNVPKYRGYTPPPMPKTSPCKPENEFPDFDDLHDKAEDVLRESRKKSFDKLINRISKDMVESALHGSFQSGMIIRQGDYIGLDLSNPDSTDCQDVRDYILAKDSRFTVIIKSLDEVYKKRWLKDDGVELIVKWGIENEAH